MLSTLRFMIAVTLLLNVSWACDENQNDQLAERREFEGYFNPYLPNPWNPFYYNYQARAPIPEFTGSFESRTPTIRPYNYLFKSGEEDSQNLPADSRYFGTNAATLINSVLFNNRFTTPINTFRPFVGLSNQLPVTVNPNFVNPFYESCTALSGESGVCASGSVCSLFGGRPSGSCSRARVCCINAITTCGGSVTLNNTYWQSPTTAVASPSTCSLTVKLDTNFVEQKRAICQVRLDLVSFSIAQPDVTTLCSTDTFKVGGALNTVPTICGDNNGQHMYLQVPPSDTNPGNFQLLFNFGSTTTATTRSWNIKIALLPCGASYLAPTDCLQYFTATTGKVSSFNWKDAAENRQIANLNYNICFRTEIVSSSQKASKMCLSPCSTSANNFLMTTDATDPTKYASKTGTTDCITDFIVFMNGQNNAVANGPPADRYCGTAFNPAAAATASATVCSAMKPFVITHVTDGNEGPDPAKPVDIKNSGFCLSFQEQ